ncbi:sugar ABC transporter permease [Paenibacillus sp. GP183]|uniref:carbohydrate ABC transporter permease n=1 Tax=Paenibacillus sp. GP183 TaxID=1882751 RepID=UPI000894DD0F|nr:sugar ABC transporter permease [Paenibacillus sp. GP183]SEC75447.1 carbohydrate ABC transporter membrane protein 1, CUT1 family [Paenibacillus sp. GP183]
METIIRESERALVHRRPYLLRMITELRAIVYLLPFLIPFAIFYLWPVGRGAWMSLHVWGIQGMQKYVGLANYKKIFTDQDFYLYVWHSFYFVIICAPTVIVLGLILALLINQNIKFRTVIRSMFFLPYVLSVSVISFIWLRLLDSKYGPINALLKLVGLPGEIHWLTDKNFAWWAITLTTDWWTVGFVMVLFLAGLQEIPTDHYEAAKIDGAGAWKQFWHITLPGLSRVMRIQVFYQIISCLKLFGQVQIMTGGGPGDSTNTMIRYIYVTGFKKDMFGLASAQSIVFCAIMLLIAVIQFKLTDRKD